MKDTDHACPQLAFGRHRRFCCWWLTLALLPAPQLQRGLFGAATITVVDAAAAAAVVNAAAKAAWVILWAGEMCVRRHA